MTLCWRASKVRGVERGERLRESDLFTVARRCCPRFFSQPLVSLSSLSLSPPPPPKKNTEAESLHQRATRRHDDSSLELFEASAVAFRDALSGRAGAQGGNAASSSRPGRRRPPPAPAAQAGLRPLWPRRGFPRVGLPARGKSRGRALGGAHARGGGAGGGQRDNAAGAGRRGLRRRLWRRQAHCRRKSAV